MQNVPETIWTAERCVYMDDQEILAQLPPRLLSWYAGSARVLPWREEPTPYRVWVSEIMLQQTRVEAVKPYYERFLNALPTVEALAQAPEELLLKLWEGLGYYNRVRNLQKGAQVVMERYGGKVPASFEELRSLPGVGDYTAGAVASIAFGIPVPAVDGNVLRVVSRVLSRRDNILDPKVKRRVEEEIRAILPSQAGDFNQSLMELGALICLPGGAPKCLLCPLREVCRGFAQGTAPELPVKTKPKPRRREERTLFLLFSPQLIGLFTTSEAVIRYGSQYMTIYASDCILVGIVFCLNGFFNGCGRAGFTMFNGLFATFLVRIPLSYLISILPGATMLHMGIAAPAASAVQILLQLIYLRSGRWRTSTLVDRRADG